MFNQQIYQRILETVKGDVDKIEEQLKTAVPSANLFYKDLNNYLAAPSKRIRSVLCILYLRAKGFEIDDRLIKLMSIIELIHNASLIHDDVIDKDNIRRGVETFNIKFGSKMAVIAGDYLLSIVMKKLSEFGSLELFEIFSKTIQNMCEGEVIQYSKLFEIPSIDEYLEKTYKKTGSLFEAGVVSSLVLAGADEDLQAAVFARNFGIAFQIRDDLNNIRNGAKDIAQGVYNAPVIYSGDKNNPAAGIEKTIVLLNNYLENTRTSISDLDDNVYKSMILELLDLLNE